LNGLNTCFTFVGDGKSAELCLILQLNMCEKLGFEEVKVSKLSFGANMASAGLLFLMRNQQILSNEYFARFSFHLFCPAFFLTTKLASTEPKESVNQVARWRSNKSITPSKGLPIFPQGRSKTPLIPLKTSYFFTVKSLARQPALIPSMWISPLFQCFLESSNIIESMLFL